jgi:chemosensory pili system protein ChpE
LVTIFFAALLLGLVFNAAPGAVFAETVRQSIRGGFRPALAVQLGSLAGDALWAVLGLAGVGFLLQLDVLRLLVGVAGVIYLLWLAWEAWQESSKHVPGAQHLLAPYHRSALRSGITLSITNPQNVAYWAALGSAMAAVGVAAPTMVHYGIFFCAFMLASLLWSFVCAGIVATVLGQAGIGWSRLTYRVCAIAFLLLALASLRNLWQAEATAASIQRTPTALPATKSTIP